jgi:hypothetical protein
MGSVREKTVSYDIEDYDHYDMITEDEIEIGRSLIAGKTPHQ